MTVYVIFNRLIFFPPDPSHEMNTNSAPCHFSSAFYILSAAIYFLLH